MCGRATYKLTWEEIVALYRLTLEQPPVNTRAKGDSKRADACSFGAGMPCPRCNRDSRHVDRPTRLPPMGVTLDREYGSRH